MDFEQNVYSTAPSHLSVETAAHPVLWWIVGRYWHPSDAGTSSAGRFAQHCSRNIVCDETRAKVAELEQLSNGQPPSIDELESFLFRGSAVKLPVLDTLYTSLVYQDWDFEELIEPLSTSRAERLALVVSTALVMEYERDADETTLAGKQPNPFSCAVYVPNFTIHIPASMKSMLLLNQAFLRG